LVLDHCLKR